tara:strand:- start:525 stop:809 length:285 start_codon:yes stop_codon:yes gene_type:complete
MSKLITGQLDEIKEMYVDIVVDRMSREDLAEYVTETLLDRFNKMPQNEFKDHIYEVEDEYLFDELVDNVNIENDTQRYRHLQEVIDERRTDIEW